MLLAGAAGPGGYSARYPTLGGICLNVGCDWIEILHAFHLVLPLARYAKLVNGSTRCAQFSTTR